MNRRDFIKRALLTTAVVASSKEIADAYGGAELKRLKNRNNPSVIEQKHVPSVGAPKSAYPGHWFDVNIKVGFMKEHPSTPEHWITMIKLLVNGKEVGRTNFKTGGVSAPVATFRIKLEKTSTLEAVENCNIHGTWISDPVKIKVA